MSDIVNIIDGMLELAKGVCPNCGKEAISDQCPDCGSIIEFKDDNMIINKCSLCGNDYDASDICHYCAHRIKNNIKDEPVMDEPVMDEPVMDFCLTKCPKCGTEYNAKESCPVCYPELKNGLTTADKIDILFTNARDFLKYKNKNYGDSAINPIQIFSKAPADDQIKNRLDDKLSRIQKSDTLRKNDVTDLFGYVALLLIQNDWTDFTEYYE